MTEYGANVLNEERIAEAVEEEENFYGDVDEEELTEEQLEMLGRDYALQEAMIMANAKDDVTGLNQASILKQTVDAYIAANGNIIKLPYLLSNRPVKTVLDGNIYYKPVRDRIRDDLLREYEMKRIAANERLPKGATKVSSLYSLPGWVVARILIATGEVKCMSTATKAQPDQGSTQIVRKHYFKNKYTGGKYKWSGQWAIVDEKNKADSLMVVARGINPAIEAEGKEVQSFLSSLDDAPVVYINARNDIIFYRNGVWDYSTETFTEYDDPRYDSLYGDTVCLSKFAVNHPYGKMWGGQKPMKFDEDGKLIEPVIDYPDGSGTWSPSYQLQAPFEIGTPEGDASYDCYIRLMQFTLRGMNGDPMYYHIWNNGDGDGTNGKGTAGDNIELQMHNLELVPDTEDLIERPVVIVAEMDQLADKQLKPINDNILSAHLIRGQEMGVENKQAAFVGKEDCKMAKNLARSQPIVIRNLYKDSKIVRFCGGLVQECNYTPAFADQSWSMMRGILVTRFNKHFGTDKGYIKSNYIRRDDVRSWIAWFITTQVPCYTEYDSASTAILRGNAVEMLKESMTSAKFFDEMLGQTPLDVIPSDVVYDEYTRWYKQQGLNANNMKSKAGIRRDMQQYAAMEGTNIGYAETMRMKKADWDVRDETNIPSLEKWGSDPKWSHDPFKSKFAGDPDSKYLIRKDYAKEDGGIGHLFLLDWKEFYIEDKKNNKVTMKPMRSCFYRKESHFDKPIECELPVVFDDEPVARIERDVPEEF